MQAALTAKLAGTLEVVVAAYIRTGRPVGSSRIAANTAIGLGAASIRNLMARLESLGYLAKPHASAGRVPTEKGYRFYVDRFVGSSHLRESDARVIRDELDPTLSAEVVLERVSQRLESLSHQLSVTVSPRPWGPYEYSVHVFGSGNVVTKLGSVDEARSLLRMLENRREIAKILMQDRCGRGTTVSIGSENRCRPMRRCSVVRSSYRMGDTGGAIGLIGPLRMEYPRLMALVDYTSKELTRFLTRAGGKAHGGKERQR
jgi:transcriptional regulator of heat shock response